MIAKYLVEKAMVTAEGAQATVVRSESSEVSFENDRLKAASSSQSTGVSVKVILRGKVGSSHTTDIDDIDGVVSRALEAAEFGSPAHFEFPGPQEASEVKTHDDAVLPVTKTDMVSIGEEMMALVKEYNADILVDAGVSKSVGKREFANSAGVEFANDSTSFGAGVYGQWVRGTDILTAGRNFGWRRRDLDHIELARKAVELFRMAEEIAPIAGFEAGSEWKERVPRLIAARRQVGRGHRG
jgi:PmbA protein